MICHLCKEDKLSEEFPCNPLTEECDHPLLHCLRCVTASVKQYQKCSHCGNDATEHNEQYQHCVQMLNFLFPVAISSEICTTSDRNIASSRPLVSSEKIRITTLSGESTTVQYDQYMTIESLKENIKEILGPPPSKQRLVYENTELKSFDQNNKKSKLSDYNVKPSSTIHLIILLYAVPEQLNHVVFDLFWGYPAKQSKDYLDASVFLYSDSTKIDVVDYKYKTSEACIDAVWHSGDVMDERQCLGHHTINVSIKSLPPTINKLIFTLSAWHSPNISKFVNPRLAFYEVNEEKTQLCSDEMDSVAYSQAVIMCSLVLNDGRWEVLSLKNESNGNAMDYSPLEKTIENLIHQQCT